MDDLVEQGRAVERDLNNGFPMTCEKGRVIQQMADRIEELEAKLAKAVEALEFYATQDVTYPNIGTVTFHGSDDNGRHARATLAEQETHQ